MINPTAEMSHEDIRRCRKNWRKIWDDEKMPSKKRASGSQDYPRRHKYAHILPVEIQFRIGTYKIE